MSCKMQLQIFTIIFDSCGGSLIDPQSIQENETVTRPTVSPTKQGYDFDNWYAENTLTTVWDFNTPVTEDITLYAKWVPAPLSKSELTTMISNGDDVTEADTSQITDMSDLFMGITTFNQDISGWTVSSAGFPSGICPLVTDYHTDPSWNQEWCITGN